MPIKVLICSAYFWKIQHEALQQAHTMAGPTAVLPESRHRASQRSMSAFFPAPSELIRRKHKAHCAQNTNVSSMTQSWCT